MPLIVILDDRATNRNIYTRLAASLEKGVTVTAFADPQLALEWLAEHPADLVITDYKMPRFDGAEFTRRFRAQLPEAILLNLYGQSEASADVTCYEVRGPVAGSAAGWAVWGWGGRQTSSRPSARGSRAMVVPDLRAPCGTGAILALGFPLGFVIYMMFPPMGPFMTELFPSAVRGTGQGFCYNAGRGIGALFPALVGWLTLRLGLGVAIVVFTLCAYSLMVAGLALLPETRGLSLESLDARTPVPVAE